MMNKPLRKRDIALILFTVAALVVWLMAFARAWRGLEDTPVVRAAELEAAMGETVQVSLAPPYPFTPWPTETLHSILDEPCPIGLRSGDRLFLSEELDGFFEGIEVDWPDYPPSPYVRESAARPLPETQPLREQEWD